eukprot:Amastigsp_a510642_78.p2 type:complete len:118 gc:universal Amastigsp_a510642_78:79-432(+)
MQTRPLVDATDSEEREPRFYERGVFACATAMPTRDSRKAFCYVTVLISGVCLLVGLPMFIFGMTKLESADEDSETRLTIVLFVGLLLSMVGFSVGVISLRIHLAIRAEQRYGGSFGI